MKHFVFPIGFFVHLKLAINSCMRQIELNLIFKYLTIVIFKIKDGKIIIFLFPGSWKAF